MATNKSDTKTSDGAIVEVAGYPEPPDIVGLKEARGSRKAAIRDLLETLENKGTAKFGESAMQKLANALGALSEAVTGIDPNIDSSGLADIADRLEGFEISESDSRNKLALWERMKRKQSPWDDFLDRLDDLAKAIPSFEDLQEARWKELAAAYKRTHATALELGNSVAAGRAKIAKANADLKPVHEKTLETRPENRGPETEAALLALRSARDDVERRVHALRGSHLHAVEVMTSVRLMAAAYQELRRQRKMIDARSLMDWDQILEQTIRSVAADAEMGDRPDFSNLINANTNLAAQFRLAASAGHDLAVHYRDARTAVSRPPEQS